MAQMTSSGGEDQSLNDQGGDEGRGQPDKKPQERGRSLPDRVGLPGIDEMADERPDVDRLHSLGPISGSGGHAELAGQGTRGQKNLISFS